MISLYVFMIGAAVISASTASTPSERDKRLLTLGVGNNGGSIPGDIIGAAGNVIEGLAKAVGQVVLTAAQLVGSLTKSLLGKTEPQQVLEFGKYKLSQLCPVCLNLPELSQQQLCVKHCNDSGWNAGHNQK